ncbi:hypothetical protein BX070DRAFT_232572 [Coemansia spiralis]|nr:hypothetical protein BX070DRAFT_232572 [Coemansia spiralis]
MHHINKLPSSILSLILDHATAPLNRWWKDWRRGLTLLQVCSLWRTHGSPLVYKYMFIYCIEADSDDDSDDESDDLATRANHTYGMLPKMKWVSNANLTIANENVSIVNKVVINLRGPGYLFPFLNGVLEILTMSQTTWESVTSLSFHLASDFAEPERAGDLTVRDQVEITARFTDLFRSMFSRINDLRINGNDAGEMFCNFADRLTYHYSMCAKRLEFLYPMSCMAPCFSEGLTYLHLVVRPYIGQLIPLVHSLPLKYLCLDGISPNFRWQCFYSQSKNGRNVCFRDLETLTVHYNAIVGVDVDAMVTSNYSGRENEELAYTLYFPSLKYLTISKCPENGGLLCNSRIPNILHTVNFEGSVGAVKALADCGITRLHNLTASLRANTISEYDQKQMVTATNYLYSVPQIENTAILCLFDNVTLPDTDELDWRNLDELTLDSPASLTQKPILKESLYATT